MTIRQRGNGGYQVDFMVKGRRYRHTFDNLSDAEAWEMDAKCLSSGNSRQMADLV